MISKNDKKQIAQKLYELTNLASPEIRKLTEDPETLRKFKAMMDSIENYKNAFVAEYRSILESVAPDWKNSKDPSDVVRQADELARKGMNCGAQMLVLLLKAAHQELGIVLGLHVGHYRIKHEYTPVTDDILEEMMYVGCKEWFEKEKEQK